MAIDTYLANFLAGNEGMPGAPLLHGSLLVVVPSNLVSGHAEITQAIAPPNDTIRIAELSGRIYPLGFGGGVRVVVLQGTYFQSFPPPAIGEIREQFSAVLVLESEKWEGRAFFTYGGHQVVDVPVVPQAGPGPAA